MDGDDATLDLSYLRSNGEKGKMKLKYHQVNKDTIEVTGTTEEGDDEFKVTLVRSK